ncbi:uncharacterized protein AKAME5_001152200 [Lates japonicus]|uniref:Ig-like domain-containing protein n=1 Tax=Lates japonicus TaxID=270547 RepID=A0AAD3MTT3_LATJO|nr:uncharacterized protein AKAME5_001152200 [Lates japonicus]
MRLDIYLLVFVLSCNVRAEPRRVSVTEGTDITLQCSHHSRESDVPRWSRESAGRQQQHTRCRISTIDKTLTVTEVKLADSGLYYCDGKPAVYLTVRASPHLWQMSVRVVVVILYLIIMISITVLTWRKGFCLTELMDTLFCPILLLVEKN